MSQQSVFQVLCDKAENRRSSGVCGGRDLSISIKHDFDKFWFWQQVLVCMLQRNTYDGEGARCVLQLPYADVSNGFHSLLCSGLHKKERVHFTLRLRATTAAQRRSLQQTAMVPVFPAAAEALRGRGSRE